MFEVIQFLMACAGIYAAYRLAVWMDSSRT